MRVWERVLVLLMNNTLGWHLQAGCGGGPYKGQYKGPHKGRTLGWHLQAGCGGGPHKGQNRAS